MFEEASSLAGPRLTSVAHYVRLALNWRYTPEDLRRYPILAGISGEPTPEDQEIACRWLDQIQRQEGRPIGELDQETIRRYIGEVIDLSLQRRREERQNHDPEESRQLLEKLRRAVPSPGEEIWMRMRKAS